MTKTSVEEVNEILDELRNIVKEDRGEEIHILSKEKISKLEKMIAFYDMVISWGVLGSWLIKIILTSAAVYIAINQLSGDFFK